MRKFSPPEVDVSGFTFEGGVLKPDAATRAFQQREGGETQGIAFCDKGKPFVRVGISGLYKPEDSSLKEVDNAALEARLKELGSRVAVKDIIEDEDPFALLVKATPKVATQRGVVIFKGEGRK